MRTTLARPVKWLLGVVITLAVVVATAATAYAVRFSDRGLPGVTVAGESITGMTSDQLADRLAERADATTVTATIDGTTTTYSLADLGLRIDTQETVADAFAANSSVGSRFAAISDHHDVPVVVDTDQAAQQSFLDELAEQAGSTAHDAKIALSDDATSFEVSPAQTGSGLDVVPLSTAAQSTATSLSSSTITLNSTEITPSITTEDAEKVADQANELVDLYITVTGQNNQAYSPTAAQKASWITIPATPQEGLGDPVIDQDQIANWVSGIADQTSTRAVTGKRTVTENGTVVSTSVEAQSGASVNNAQQIASGISDAMDNAQPFADDFTFDTTDATWDEKVIADGAQNLLYQASPGEKWVDIDLTTNSVTAYEGGTAVRDPMLMVPGAPGLETVTGTYQIYLKYEVQTMRGLNPDGTEYVAPNIPWVSYFTGSYAMHAAPWRDSFGWSGEGGSHGCVNMPTEAAKFIYDWAPIGTTVVSHY